MKKLALKYLIEKPATTLAGRYFRMNPNQITCREFNEAIFDKIEENLTPKQADLFERHRRACPICRNFLSTYMATYKAKDHISPYKDIQL